MFFCQITCIAQPAGRDSVAEVLRMGLKTVLLNVSIFIPLLRMYLTVRLRDTGYFGLVVQLPAKGPNVTEWAICIAPN